MSTSDHKTGTQLGCFSPPVMLATLTTEIALAFYTLWRYTFNQATKLASIMLVTLATFQLAEYFVCTGYGLHAEQWSRLGFVAITALPPLGLHMMYTLAKKPANKVVYGAYGTMGAFMIFFLTYKTAFIGYQCTGNYVIFQMGPKIAGAYSVYYYGWLATGIGLGVKWANKLRDAGKKQRERLEAVRALIIGYLIFLVPTALAMTFQPETRQAIPSVMCGFAVLFALTLGLYIMPRAGKVKEETGKLKLGY